MKNAKTLLIAMLILPWLSVPFLGLKTVKRFLPAAIFINLVVVVKNIIGHKRGWWRVFKKIGPNWRSETLFAWGPFIVGFLWILKAQKKPLGIITSGFCTYGCWMVNFLY